MPVGSTVAIRRHPSDPWHPPGYGTQFYIGDVIEVHCAPCDSAGGSSSAAERRVHLWNYKPCYKAGACKESL